MYSRLETILLMLIFLEWLLVLFFFLMLNKGWRFKDVTKFNADAKKNFNINYKNICKDKNLLLEVKNLKVMMWQVMLARKWKIIMPFLIAFSLLIIPIGFDIFKLYVFLSLFGILFTLIGTFYGLIEYLKTPEKMVLLNKNFPDS